MTATKFNEAVGQRQGQRKIKPGSILLNGTGAIVIASRKLRFDKCFIVFAIKPTNGEYVTWQMDEEGNTFHGHYTQDFYSAIDDYEKRQ